MKTKRLIKKRAHNMFKDIKVVEWLCVSFSLDAPHYICILTNICSFLNQSRRTSVTERHLA